MSFDTATPNLFVLPVAGHDLAGLAQAGADEAVLTVAVGGLVEVHEVHVDFVVRDLLVVLGGKVAPGLLQVAQPVDPHLGRGEGVAPGHDAGALAAEVGLPDNVADLFVGLGGHLVDQRIGQNLGKLLRHFLRAGLHGLQNLRPVKELRADDKPKFVFTHVLTPYLMTFRALRSMVRATKSRKMMPLISCWV